MRLILASTILCSGVARAAECAPATSWIGDGYGWMDSLDYLHCSGSYQTCDGSQAFRVECRYSGGDCPWAPDLCHVGGDSASVCAPRRSSVDCSNPDSLDPHCNGQINCNCATCKTPMAGTGGSGSCGDPNKDTAGDDPILLSSRAAVTDPFTDFSVERTSRLSLTRTYNSADYSLADFSAAGAFGTAWHHDWEAHLSCTADRICTVYRGTLPGFQFLFSSSQLSLDGTETWDVYVPHVVAPFKPQHHHVLVNRPGGEWIVYNSGGGELHFATTCTTCDVQNGAYCKAAQSGGRARLTRIVDATGNGVDVDYDPKALVPLRLTDDLGHALELRSSAACAARASELRYDGAAVARYSFSGSNLTSVTDAAAGPMRSYAYGSGSPARLTAVKSGSGNPIAEFSYDTSGAAIGVVDARSSVAISYAADGWSTTVTEYFRGLTGDTSSSHTRNFDYAGHVVSISAGGSSGPARNIAWKPGGRVGCTIDPQGRVVYEDHDALGRVTYRLEYTGERCEIPGALPADAREEWRAYGVTRPIAQGVSIELDVPTRVWRRSALVPTEHAEERSDYDPAPSAIDPPGYACTATPLPAGSVQCRRIESGYVTRSSGPQLERHATFYSYDARGRLVRTYGPIDLDSPGPYDVPPLEERTYWADGETSARQGRLHEVKRQPGPSAAPLVTSYDYDAFGVSRITEPDGRQTIIARDVRGRPTVVSQTNAAGTVRASSETRYYDGLTPRLRILASGAAERYTYDLRGRLTKVERLSSDPDASGASPVIGWVERYTYDLAGNRIHAERADGAGRIAWSQDRAYDVEHRVVWETNPSTPAAGKSWAYDASGFLAQTVDEEGRASTFTPDGLGRVGKVQRRGLDASGAPASIDVAAYLYGVGTDTLASVQDADGHATRYAYDDFGRVQTVDADTLGQSGRWLRYDARGNPLQRGDATITVTYTYDGLDRVLTTSASNTADRSSVFYQYVYDEGPNLGQLTSILETDRTVQYAYDWAGRLAAETVTEPGVATPLVTQYAYDADGALSQLTYPTGLQVLYSRDPATGMVTSVTTGAGVALATAITHFPGGALSSLTFGNGLTLSESFDYRGAPLSVSSGPVVLGYIPTPAGDVNAVTDQSQDPSGCVHAGTRTFGYDLLDRLSWWSDSVTPGSNHCPAETIGDLAAGFTYVDGTDRLAAQWKPDTSGSAAYAFGYDQQGNVSAIGQYSASGTSLSTAMCLRHDAFGRLAMLGYTSTALTPGGTACLQDSDVTSTVARFRYDSQNRRVARQLATGWTYFVLDSNGQVLSELAPSSNAASPWTKLRDYVWLDGRPIAQLEYQGGLATLYYVHTDHLGTPRALTNDVGALAWSTFQRPFGEVGEKLSPDPQSGATVVTNLRLPGQYDERLLGPLGLQGPYYNWNRWYLPGVGRYLEPDPLALDGEFNTDYGVDWYGYAGGNPLVNTDPEGLALGGPWKPDFKIRCTREDSCPVLSGKIWLFEASIWSHEGWDKHLVSPRSAADNPARYKPHTQEIEELKRGLANCKYIYLWKCTSDCPPKPAGSGGWGAAAAAAAGAAAAAAGAAAAL